ncbi:hypothetical protein AHF37_07890 [Paragonimus kellicotti]|nr:hypothetical protein AHF37_07890 [Paragonimus kellicotti]
MHSTVIDCPTSILGGTSSKSSMKHITLHSLMICSPTSICLIDWTDKLQTLLPGDCLVVKRPAAPAQMNEMYFEKPVERLLLYI